LLCVEDAGLREEAKLGADVVEGVFDLVAHDGGGVRFAVTMYWRWRGV